MRDEAAASERRRQLANSTLIVGRILRRARVDGSHLRVRDQGHGVANRVSVDAPVVAHAGAARRGNDRARAPFSIRAAEPDAERLRARLASVAFGLVHVVGITPFRVLLAAEPLTWERLVPRVRPGVPIAVLSRRPDLLGHRRDVPRAALLESADEPGGSAPRGAPRAAQSALPLQHVERDLDAGAQGRSAGGDRDDRAAERLAARGARRAHRGDFAGARDGLPGRLRRDPADPVCRSAVRREEHRARYARGPGADDDPAADRRECHRARRQRAARRRPRERERRSRTTASLVIEVRDSGPGFPPGAGHDGIGLANTRARLEQLYGSHYRFEYGSMPEGGASVRITIPFHQRPL